jgi:hypothetical protein
VTAVRVGAQDVYDRFVVQFSGAVPAYRVDLQAGSTFTELPSGKTVRLAGTNGITVRIQHVANWAAYSGPSSLKPGYRYIREARLVENFKGAQEWALGIQGNPCARVFTLSSPARLVVDVAGS